MKPLSRNFHEVFNPDLLMLLFGWLDPRSVKLFGATCALHLGASKSYLVSAAYGERLWAGLLKHLTDRIALAHEGCPAPPDQKETEMSYFVRDLARGGAAPLCGPPSATRRLVYLVARGCAPLAPYALEWCALREESEGSPRPELLALLWPDALERLEGVARARGSKSGLLLVRVCRACAPPPGQEEQNAYPEVLSVVQDATKRMLEAPRMGAPGDILLCCCIRAAAVAELGEGAMDEEKRNAWDWLSGTKAGHPRPLPADLEWVRALGLNARELTAVEDMEMLYICGDGCYNEE